MGFYLICVLATFTILVLDRPAECQINEPNEYAATLVPKNPTSIRDALGYSKYDRNEVKNSDKSILYGNNWESFDKTANDKSQNTNLYNKFQLNDNQRNQQYRYDT